MTSKGTVTRTPLSWSGTRVPYEGQSPLPLHFCQIQISPHRGVSRYRGLGEPQGQSRPGDRRVGARLLGAQGSAILTRRGSQVYKACNGDYDKKLLFSVYGTRPSAAVLVNTVRSRPEPRELVKVRSGTSWRSDRI